MCASKNINLFSENIDVHVHTPYSACCEDISLEKLTEKALNENMAYAVTDHSAHLYFPRELAWSLHDDRFKELYKEYHEYGRSNIKKYIAESRASAPFVGVELDIYSDGTLVFEDDLFAELDLVLGAVHFLSTIKNKMSEREIIVEFMKLTEMLLSSGRVDVLAHPFRTLLYNKVSVNDDLIKWTVECCRKNGVAVELNSHYKFPDHDRKMVEAALLSSVRIVYGSDAHRMDEFGEYSYQKNIMSEFLIDS